MLNVLLMLKVNLKDIRKISIEVVAMSVLLTFQRCQYFAEVATEGVLLKSCS